MVEDVEGVDYLAEGVDSRTGVEVSSSYSWPLTAGVKEKLLSDIEEFLGEDTRKWYKDMMT